MRYFLILMSILLCNTSCRYCDFATATFSLTLMDKTNNKFLINNGLYGNDSLKIYRVSSADLTKPYLIPTSQFISSSAINDLVFSVREDERMNLLLQFSPLDTDTLIFECEKSGGKNCLECSGSYNGQKLCEPCQDAETFKIYK